MTSDIQYGFNGRNPMESNRANSSLASTITTLTMNAQRKIVEDTAKQAPGMANCHQERIRSSYVMVHSTRETGNEPFPNRANGLQPLSNRGRENGGSCRNLCSLTGWLSNLRHL
jgi:hypothetical protein